MRILFLGDVVGRTGRTAIAERLAGLRAEWKLDFVVVNGENATGGAGLSPDHAKALYWRCFWQRRRLEFGYKRSA